MKLGELDLNMLNKLLKKYNSGKDIPSYLNEIMHDIITKMIQFFTNSQNEVEKAIKYIYEM